MTNGARFVNGNMRDLDPKINSGLAYPFEPLVNRGGVISVEATFVKYETAAARCA